MGVTCAWFAPLSASLHAGALPWHRGWHLKRKSTAQQNMATWQCNNGWRRQAAAWHENSAESGAGSGSESVMALMAKWLAAWRRRKYRMALCYGESNIETV